MTFDLLFLLSLADGPAVEAGGGGEHQNNQIKTPKMMKMANKTTPSTLTLSLAWLEASVLCICSWKFKLLTYHSRCFSLEVIES